MASSTDDKLTGELHHRQMQAVLIRDSLTAHVGKELMYNPNPNWPMLLQMLNVSLSQLSTLTESINPFLQYYTIFPTQPLPNASDTPLFLGTRPLPEMESKERALAVDPEIQTHPVKDANEAELQHIEVLMERSWSSEMSGVEKRKGVGEESDAGPCHFRTGIALADDISYTTRTEGRGHNR